MEKEKGILIPDNLQCVKVVMNSVEDIERDQISPLKSSPKKYAKRKNTDLRESTSKKLRSGNSNKESSECDSSNEGLRNRARKTKDTSKSSRKNNLDIDPDEIKNVLEGMDEEIDNVLEETAHKNRLTATNVKNILRHVITNEYVLAMVRNTMKAENNEGDELEEAVFEPKLTRSKVKELKEKQHMLPWPIQPSTPIKQAEPEIKGLLEEEFPDESSSDEDYKPNEEECSSEEENLGGSPKSTDLNSSIIEKAATLVTKPTEETDDDIGLVIVEPEPEPVLETVSLDNEVDIISLRTRSKLPLNDIPLEEIEASFIAPDITEDIYDTDCDNEDWLKFLRDLSKSSDAIEVVEKPSEEPDDPEEDPEYNALEDEDAPDELDLRYDNSVKITRKELNALISETWEFDLSLLHEIDDMEDDEEETDVQGG